MAMKLIGMLDSPYVRRVAVCLDVLGVPFEHEAVSVFSHLLYADADHYIRESSRVLMPGGYLHMTFFIMDYIRPHLGQRCHGTVGVL